MNNEEKKQFILNAHSLYMEFRPYDGSISFEQLKQKEDEFWQLYSSIFCSLIPKLFYKYRKPTEEAITNFENDEAWFSHPSNFDDTVDSTINNDIEEELEEFEKNPRNATERLAKSFVNAFAKKLGVRVDEDLISEALPLFNEDGSFNETDTKQLLAIMMPQCATDKCISQLKKATDEVTNNEVMDSVKGFLMKGNKPAVKIFGFDELYGHEQQN